MHMSALAAGSASSQEYEGFIGWVLSLIDTMGEVGVGLAVLIENFFPPIPSEAILPAAGFLSYAGRMNFWAALVAATLGSLIGAWVWYGLGAALGRRRTRWIFEKMPLVDAEDFDKAEAFFERWGGLAVLLGRCVPIVRSFISIPAGVERMSLAMFSLYSALGSLVWNAIWIGLGFGFGPAIEPVLEQWSGVLSKLVVGVILALLAWFVIARLRRNARRRREAGAAPQSES
jgi:membrane protein DedA with SNARE-associated domain